MTWPAGALPDLQRTDQPLAGFEMPSLHMVRRLTDRHVVGQLMEHDVLTRAAISARTGISKPTISESVRRLELEGRVVPSGSQVGGRGRSGTYYRLADGLGVAIAMHAGPEGVFANVVDLHGRIVHQCESPIEVPCTPRQLTTVLERIVGQTLQAVDSVPTKIRSVSLSFADPVDQRADRIAAMPNSPFLIGELKPYALLERLGFDRDVVLVDNDTNFGALAESRLGAGTDVETFSYLWLGAGIGIGIVVNGVLHRGWSGLAGELWQTITFVEGHGPMYLNECFQRLGIPHTPTGAVDLDKLAELFNDPSPVQQQTLSMLVDAVAITVANSVAVLNPRAIIVAGPWADAARESLASCLSKSPINAEIREPRITGNSFLIGAQVDALDRARLAVLNTLT